MANETLGHIDCPTCDEPGAEVRQTKRRGAHLYWQCAECGLNQPTGARIQKRLWQGATWATGAQPIRPANVSAEEPRAAPAAEFDPTEAETDEPATEAEAPAPSRGKAVGLFALASLGLGFILAMQ